jgi:uncharacterized membrane protein
MTILMTLYLVSGSLLILLSIPLVLRKIPPNPIYGFRVRWTMEDPELWYSVNAFAGKWLSVVGIFSILGAVGLSLIPGIPLILYAFVCLAIFVFTFTLALVQSARFLRMQDSQK